MSRNRENGIRKREKDNKGAAIIMVIVAIAFIGMLVAMIVYMAYCNYLMKGTDRVAKDNFYSAETALDVINAGLQHDVSDSMAEAYVETMQNSAGLTQDQMSLNFQINFFKSLEKKIAVAGVTPLKWNMDHLKDMWTNDGVTVAAAQGDEGAWLTTSSHGTNLLVQRGTSYITLQNLSISYTDSRGYVSIIETDIRVKVPELNYAVASTRLDVENYSLIANDALINDKGYVDGDSNHVGGSVNTSVTGNVFGGNDGIYVANQTALRFIDDTSDAVDNYYLVANTYNVNNVGDSEGLIVDDKHLNYVSNINVTTGRLDLDGTTFVSDDLTIDGSASKIKVSGIYRGYGNSLSGAGGSSSILINGARTTIDFSQLDELLLSGHAYVGTTHYDADSDRYKSVYSDSDGSSDYIENIQDYEAALDDEDSAFEETENTVRKNTSDVLLGESLSVKADQLIYMIPAECMGYVAKTGEQKIAKNPMSYEEYRTLTETYVKDADGKPTTELYYQPVNLGKLWDKLGSVYTSSYKAVFRRVNGSVLVYFYLDFGSNETQANSFFKAYYEYDPVGLTNYVKAYVPTITWNPALNSNDNEKLTLAGNAFYFNRAGELVLQEDTLNADSEKLENSISNADMYADTFTALMHMLKPSILDTTTMQQSQSIFDNIVDVSAVRNRIKTQTFTSEDGAVTAHVDIGDYVYTSSSPMNLIIALGNVYLRSDFDGLVIAGGNIYIGEGCTKVTYNPSAVLKALRAKCPAGYYAYEALGDSGTYTYAETTTVAKDDTIDLGSLIVYQNWKKE